MGRNPMVSDDPDVDRYSGRRGMIAVAAVLLCIVGLLANEMRLQAKLDRADDQVVAWAKRLSADKDDKNMWRRWPTPTLPENDPWGHPLRVRYQSDKSFVRLTVSSDGPDGEQYTRDDPEESATDVNWVGVVLDGAEAVEGVAGALSRGLVGGAIEGVTDHIPKPLRDKLDIPSSHDNKDAEKK